MTEVVTTAKTAKQTLERETNPRYLGNHLPHGVQAQRQFLNPIWGYTKIKTVNPTDGSETILNSGVFSFFGEGYENYDLSIPSNVATKRHRIVLGEQVKDASPGEIVQVVRSIHDRIFQQSQVAEICRQFPFFFDAEAPVSTFFPIMLGKKVEKDLSNIIIVSVFPCIEGIGTNLWSLSDRRILSASNKARFSFLFY